MKAIQVKYLSATNTKGSRLKAMAHGVKSLTTGLNYGVNSDERPLEVAKDLCRYNNWPTDLIGGQLPNGDYVFCFKNQ